MLVSDPVLVCALAVKISAEVVPILLGQIDLLERVHYRRVLMCQLSLCFTFIIKNFILLCEGFLGHCRFVEVCIIISICALWC